MNIFVLDKDPIKAAQMQCDKHVVKMIVESAQLLSTAHRILDGTEEIRITEKGRKLKYWRHPNDKYENELYKPTHFNHPCAVWTREGFYNYHWLYTHFCALLDEYTFRYEKIHKSSKLKNLLSYAPFNIPTGETPFKLCMNSAPECINYYDPVQSYRDFYKTKKDRFNMNWTNREEYKTLLLN